MKIGVDIYSLRHNDWNAFEIIEYASKIGLNVVHFSEMEPFESLETGYLREVKKRANELNISLEVGMGSICPSSVTFRSENGTAPEQVTRMLHVAAELGSSALRCYLGSNADRHTDMGIQEKGAHLVETIREVRDLAIALDVKFAIENHAGDMQGSELARLIEAAGEDIVGACIDAGNPLWVAESPFVTLEHLAPYILMCHVRDSAVWEQPSGAAVQWVAMGEGNIGIEEWSKELIKRKPDSNFTLEIITSLPPRVLNYLDLEYWEVYQDTPAHEFAKYLKLIKNGYPYVEPIITLGAGDHGPDVKRAIAQQQREKLEKSVTYCRDVLGIGE